MNSVVLLKYSRNNNVFNYLNTKYIRKFREHTIQKEPPIIKSGSSHSIIFSHRSTYRP